MSIVRSNPNVGYIDSDFLVQAGISQTVRANGFVHLSGVVAATGAGEILFPGDLRSQATFILEIIGKLLAAEGLDYSDLVSLTVFTTDMPALNANADLFAAAQRQNPPCSTWVGVTTLAHPDVKLEIAVVAACRSQ